MGKKSRQKWVNRELKEEKKKNKGKVWMTWLLVILTMIAIGLGGYLGYIKYKDKNNTQDMTDKNIDNQIAVLDTSLGVIKFRLYASAAPKTVENFVGLANKGFYDGVKFHRVIQDFMIQSGDPLSKDDSAKDSWGTGGESIWGEDFADEINIWELGLTPEAIKSLQDGGYQYEKNLKSINIVPGAVAMANRGPSTNSSQFFIVTENPQPQLDGRHTAFGQVIVGMDIVKKIAAVEKDDSDRPIEDVIVNKVTIEEDQPKAEITSEDGSSNIDGIKVNVEGGDGTIDLGNIKVETAE